MDIDPFDALRQTSAGRRILDMMEETTRKRDGVARQAYWECEDGWMVAYTTLRVKGGPHDGKFVAQLFKPNRRGSKATGWVENKRVVRSTRKAARAQAERWYRRHSPKWDARHPEV